MFEKEPWASDMTTILLDALQLTKTARSQGRDAVDPEAIKEIERRYGACCEQATTFHENRPPLTPLSKQKKRGRRKRRIEHNLALRFKALKTAVLLFLNELTVPFTNNEAERDLRMTKVRQKVSGCFRTKEGAENFCILRTVIETARKQGWDIMQTLRTEPDQLILMLNPSWHFWGVPSENCKKIRSDFSISVQYVDLNDSQHDMLTSVVSVGPSCGFREVDKPGAIV